MSLFLDFTSNQMTALSVAYERQQISRGFCQLVIYTENL